jgi:hypothetical protein
VYLHRVDAPAHALCVPREAERAQLLLDIVGLEHLRESARARVRGREKSEREERGRGRDGGREEGREREREREDR